MSEDAPPYGKDDTARRVLEYHAKQLARGRPVFDTEHRDCPFCPHCGKAQRRPSWGMYDGERGHIHCADCGEVMLATMHITTTWSTVAR